MLIYATSNRRHLIREKFSDKRELDDELHNNDTVQEKLSLAARFGVTIYYGSPDKRQFETIVKALADRHGLDMPEQELCRGQQVGTEPRRFVGKNGCAVHNPSEGKAVGSVRYFFYVNFT